MALHVVVMGVAGCGKSEVGRLLAQRLGLPLVEGDEFHPQANIDKMRSGVPLDDNDRAGWLDILAAELEGRPDGAVLTCSALKKAYRERLRHGVPGLCFVHLSLPLEVAQARVAARGGHFYPPALVASQFDTLEDPAGEPRVLTADATQSPDALSEAAAGWLRAFNNA